MTTVRFVSGSLSPTSRTACLLRRLDARLAAQGHGVIPLCPHPSNRSPAGCSGLLKSLLDLLPQYAPEGKTVLRQPRAGARHTSWRSATCARFAALGLVGSGVSDHTRLGKPLTRWANRHLSRILR